MIESLDDVVHGIGTPTLVQSAGFGQKGKRVVALHPAYNGLDKIGRDVGVVVALTHVELDRHLVLGLDNLIESRSLNQLVGGGQPLFLAAVVGKLGENNPGFLDDVTS